MQDSGRVQGFLNYQEKERPGPAWVFFLAWSIITAIFLLSAVVYVCGLIYIWENWL